MANAGRAGGDGTGLEPTRRRDLVLGAARPARCGAEPARRVPVHGDDRLQLHLRPVAHASGVPVLWVNWGNRPDRLNLSPALLHVYNPDGRSIGLGYPLPGHGAPVLQKDSWAAEVVQELQPEAADIRIDKYRMSGFWDTPLDSILRNLGVTTLLFGGVNADQCVLCTLQDASPRRGNDACAALPV